MASFQKTGKGWRVQLDVKGQRESRSFPNKALAQEWADRRQAELRSIQSGQGSKTHTVGHVLDDYQRKISPTKRGERWEKLRLELIGKIEVEGRRFCDIRLADLRPAHIAAWRDARLARIDGGRVVELFEEPVDGFTMKDRIHPALICAEITNVQPQPQQGWIATQIVQGVGRFSRLSPPQ
jgi:hypothetical protein